MLKINQSISQSVLLSEKQGECVEATNIYNSVKQGSNLDKAILELNSNVLVEI